MNTDTQSSPQPAPDSYAHLPHGGWWYSCNGYLYHYADNIKRGKRYSPVTAQIESVCDDDGTTPSWENYGKKLTRAQAIAIIEQHRAREQTVVTAASDMSAAALESGASAEVQPATAFKVGDEVKVMHGVRMNAIGRVHEIVDGEWYLVRFPSGDKVQYCLADLEPFKTAPLGPHDGTFLDRLHAAHEQGVTFTDGATVEDAVDEVRGGGISTDEPVDKADDLQPLVDALKRISPAINPHLFELVRAMVRGLGPVSMMHMKQIADQARALLAEMEVRE